MADRLVGKTVMVTGGLGGIGGAVLDLAVSEGAAAVVVADLDAGQVESAAEARRQGGATALAVPLDVTDEDSWASAIALVTKELGGVHVLVNNAGITNRRGVLETELEDWNRVLGVNLTGVFLGMKHAGAAMAAAGGGAIVNIASVGSHTGYRAASYAASKWGVRGLTRTAADELGPRGIRVNSVSPGFVATPLTAAAPNLVRSFSEATPLGRLCSPSDIAAAVIWMASDESAYVTGEDLLVDGGFMSNVVRDVRA